MDDLNVRVGRVLTERRGALADAITERHYQRRPELAKRYGDIGRAKCKQDTGYHLQYLSEAIAAAQETLFADYIAWAKVMLAGRNISGEDLADNLLVMRQVLVDMLDESESALVCGYIDHGVSRLPQLPSGLPSCMSATHHLSDLAKNYLAALLKGQHHEANRLIKEAVESGSSVKDLYLQVFQNSQYEIGRLWQMNQVTVAQEHFCTAATQMIMSQLYPYIFSHKKNGRRMVATCVGGDLHELGVRMVADFFEMAGWDTFYLGANMPAGDVVNSIVKHHAQVLAISATMTYHIQAVAELVAAVRRHEACAAVKVMVGGYPFKVSPDLWQTVGADATANDAADAIVLANRFFEGIPA